MSNEFPMPNASASRRSFACHWSLVILWSLLIGHWSFAQAPQPAATSLTPQTNETHLIDLPTALRLAGARNLDIRIAREKLAEARAINESATWQFFPWLAPGVTYRRHENLIQNVEGKIIDVKKDSYTVGPTVTAQVDLGDAIFKKLAAQQLVKAADFALEAQRQESLLAAAQGYFDLAKAQASVGVANEALGISTNYYEQVQQAAAAGIAFKGDALRVQVQTERNRLTLRQAQEQARVASARLAQTLHLNPAIDLAPEEGDLVPLALVQTNASLDALVAQAFAARPEFGQTRAQLEAARNARSGAVYGPLIPSLGAQVFVGGLGGGKDGEGSRFGESQDYQFTLGWRVGPGGLFDRGKVHASKSRVNIAALTSDKVSDEITRQVIESHTRFRSQADQLATTRSAVGAAEATLRLTRERKEFGVGAVLENIQAEQELARAHLDHLNAIAEFNKAQYSLSRAIGSLSEQVQKEPAP